MQSKADAIKIRCNQRKMQYGLGRCNQCLMQSMPAANKDKWNQRHMQLKGICNQRQMQSKINGLMMLLIIYNHLVHAYAIKSRSMQSKADAIKCECNHLMMIVTIFNHNHDAESLQWRCTGWTSAGRRISEAWQSFGPGTLSISSHGSYHDIHRRPSAAHQIRAYP